MVDNVSKLFDTADCCCSSAAASTHAATAIFGTPVLLTSKRSRRAVTMMLLIDSHAAKMATHGQQFFHASEVFLSMTLGTLVGSCQAGMARVLGLKTSRRSVATSKK